MKGVLRILAKLNVAVALIFLSTSVCAEYSSDAPSIKRLRIDFVSAPDWIEIHNVEEVPEKLVIQLARGGGIFPIAAFNQDGPAFPELVSIFKNKVGERKILFVIVKWRYYLSGVGTEGDYYEVHAYEAKGGGRGEIIFSENRRISDFFGSGFDGKQEGKVVHFRFKDAAAIRKSLSRCKDWITRE
ncbi:hypothetical protein PQQ75_12660 [Paraburkholderia aspalathi]|uniref:hypothetical protein n=1 Tax=Paraburkholderia aspalathi TaxID=1324617 RepID=UPI0038BD133F